MSSITQYRKILAGTFLFLLAALLWALPQPHADDSTAASPSKKIYWFIPDGMRADPDLFKLFEWAEIGELPNIKRMMDQGAFGYSISAFPTHTPVNFASLLTGATPKVHGVADGPMHIEGRTLSKVAIGGFSSVAKKVPPIWVTLEENKKKVILLSVPGSTPPELEEGITVRGRWGGWGADFHALNFESKGDMTQRKKQGRGSRLFFFGPELTRYIDTQPATEWKNAPKSFSPSLEVKLEGWGKAVFALIYDSTNDKKTNYNKVAFSYDKEKILAVLGQGQWSDWNAIDLKFQEENVNSDVKFKIIKLDINDDKDKAFFRFRVFYSNINRLIVKPGEVADEVRNAVGPMVDTVDNFPAQLIYYPEDKQTFLEESDMSFEWHKKAAQFMIKHYKPDVFIQDIYNPNQMLTSRWWMGYIDPMSVRYNDVDEKERKNLWKEVKDMYKKLDAILGEYLAQADKDTIIVLSSDHGAIPINKEVKVNNLFAKEGLLKFTLDENTGEPIIDWANSKAIYLKMDNVYVHPDGLAGDWKRGSGPEYEALRDKVKGLLENLTDTDGTKPVESVVKWEDAPEYFDLPQDRVGDLVIANKAGYGWGEEFTADLNVFTTPLYSGYKQAVDPKHKGMWTPFVIMGPGVKKNTELKEPIRIIDQYPTIMKLLGVESPSFVEGKVITEILE